MSIQKLYCAGETPACKYACRFLHQAGIPVSDFPDWDTGHLLLDVPSFRPGLRSEESFDTLLASLPGNITVWGGNLDHPSLDTYSSVDLLKDEIYLTKNAGITADCTIPIAESALNLPWRDTSALIIGWGRIGRSLAEKLKDLGCDVTVSSRSSLHADEAASLGFHTVRSLQNIPPYHLIVNTAPAHVFSVPEGMSSVCIDLASVKGIEGKNVIRARALPGRYAPERSGKLIADSVMRLSGEVF